MQENTQQKLARLLLTAGMDQINFDKKFTAITPRPKPRTCSGSSPPRSGVPSGARLLSRKTTRLSWSTGSEIWQTSPVKPLSRAARA